METLNDISPPTKHYQKMGPRSHLYHQKPSGKPRNQHLPDSSEELQTPSQIVSEKVKYTTMDHA